MNPSGHDNDGWARSGRDDYNNRRPQQPPPYSAVGNYAAMGQRQQPHHHQQQQWLHDPINNRDAHQTHDHYGSGGRHPSERNNRDFRRQDSGGGALPQRRASAASRPLCKFFAQGHCRYGSSCWNRHEESPSERPEESREYDVASHYYGRADSNRSVSSENPGFEDFGRRKPPPEQLGGHQNSNGMQLHHCERADSKPVSSNKSGTDEFGRKKFPEQEGNNQASPESSNEKFWSNLASKMKEKAAPKSPQKKAANNNIPESTTKKTIKWGTDLTHTFREKNYCKLPGCNLAGIDHLWSECPENPYSKKKKKVDAPTLTPEESRAMMRAALNASTESAAAAPAIVSKATAAAKPDYYAKVATNSDNTPKPLAKPNSQAISINSLYSTMGLKNNQLKRPPTVVASHAGTSVAHSMSGSVTALHKPTVANAVAGSAKAVNSSLSGDTIPRQVPRRNLPELVRKNSSELTKRNSLLIDTAASKLKSAAPLQSPTPRNGQQQKFMSRSQRAMSKRPSPDEQTPVNKRKKVQPKQNMLTSPVGRRRMTCKKGQWRQVAVPVAPLGNNAVAITKHKTTRLLSKKVNPFDSQDAEDGNESDASKEKEDASMDEYHHCGTNIDFGDSGDVGEENVEENLTQNASKQLPVSKSNIDRMKSPELICLDSTDEDENDAEETEDQPPTSDDILNTEEEEKEDAEDEDEQMQEPTSEEEEKDQYTSTFTDAQIDEMEADLLDFAEFCIKKCCSTYNSASLHNVLTNKESTVSDESSQEDTDDGYRFDNIIDDNVQTDPSTKHYRNAPQDSSISSSNSDSRENFPALGDSQMLSVNTMLEPTQRSSTSSVTPSPEGNTTSHPPSTHTKDPKPSSSNCELFPAFLTCNRCHLVFAGCRLQEVVHHENTCNSESQLGRVFDNAFDLYLHINEVEFHEGSQSDLKCYFHPPPSQSASGLKLNNNDNSSPSACTKNANKKSWDLKYDAVENFYNTHGHLNLPNKKSTELGNLYAWLAQQKHKFRDGTLLKRRAEKLRKLDDNFAAKLNNGSAEPKNIRSSTAGSKSKKKRKPLKPWDMRYEAVKRFHAQNGHFNMPNEETPELGNLFEWFTNQKNKLRYGTLSDKHIPKFNKLLGDPSDIERPKKTIKEDEIRVMQSVNHLCSTDLSSGLPRQRIVILDSLTDMLHYFQTEIRESNITKSGRGAFLTYLGAKILNAEAHARSERLMAEHLIAEDHVHYPMSAVTQQGKRMSVTVTPDSLLPNENNALWSKARSNAYDKHCKKNPNSHFDESSVVCSVHSEVQALRSQIPKGERIGLLGINSVADYVNDDTVSFWNRDLFELGRYGPFRPEDVYPEFLFNFKNFLFDYEPHEWAYSINHDHERVIDITDDSTGQLHDIARQHTSIYVNEVGHATNLHENVLIREKGDCSVHYFVSIDEQHAMKKGDTVELLVNYGDHYEPVRERKGYGLVNEQGVGGDDEDKARLQRNFAERREIENEIVDLSFTQLCEVTRFILKIYQSIMEATQKPDIIKSRHIIARRRLSWLAERFVRRLDILQTSAPGLRHWFHKWQFMSHNIAYMNINLDDTTDIGKSVWRVIIDEISEELLYSTPLLTNPMDESIWSNVAVALTKHCLSAIAAYVFKKSSDPKTKRLSDLYQILLEGVVSCATAVRKAARFINDPNGISATQLEEAISFLAFKTCHKQLIQSESFLLFDKSNVINLYNSTTPKCYGEAATLAEIQAYQDALDLCSIETSYAWHTACSRIAPQDSNLVLISKYHPEITNLADVVNAPQFLWMPRTVDVFRKGNAKVHEDWYLYNQVVLVAHLLAGIVDWNCDTATDDSRIYSLNAICLDVGLDVGTADAIISRGAFKSISPLSERKKSPTKARKIAHKATSQTKKAERKKKPTKSKSELKTLHSKLTVSTKTKTPSLEADNFDPKTNGITPNITSNVDSSPEERTVFDGPDDRFPGWNNLRIKRKNDSEHIDNFWYHPDHQEIKVRSTIGVREIMNTMSTEQVDFRTACVQLKNAGKHYINGSGRARSPASG